MGRRRLFLATLVAVVVINLLTDSGHTVPMNGDIGAELEEGYYVLTSIHVNNPWAS